MNLNERKKDIARKLRLLGADEKSINLIIKENYNSAAINLGRDVEIEKKVNYHYKDIMSIRIDMMSFNYKFKDIFYN